MQYPYAGRFARIDLSSSGVLFESISEDDAHLFLLGSGLAARTLDRELDPSLDPLDSRSPLLVFNGLLTGSMAPTACRSSWCGRSPLTGIWNESNMGGHWGAELRFAGLDGLILSGRAAAPIYLWVHDGRVEVRPAAHLWGLDHFETFNRLRAETDPKAQVASIGLAGENQVRMAAVMQGGNDHARAAGRGGMGALLGSKNVKAIAVRGSERTGYADPAGMRDYVQTLNRFIQGNSVGMSQLGTPGGVIGTELTGDMPLRNWTLGSWKEGAARISGQRMAETILERHTRCFACPIGCGMNVRIPDGPYAGVWGHGPEYETLAGFGGNCQCDDLNAITAMNDLCNRYGLDTISTSSAIAFAMEAHERGLITRSDSGGLNLAWGDAEAMIEAVHAIARRQGLGALLADGVREAARRLGPEAEHLAIHVKGMEIPYHDPRAFVSMAANYATAARGACHLEAISYWVGYGVRFAGWCDPAEWEDHDSHGKAQVAVDFQNYVGVFNPLGLCKFIGKGRVTPQQLAELVHHATGWDWSAGDLLRTGERIFNLKRLINLRLGITQADDTLPARLLTQPRPTGGAAGVLPDLALQLSDYYRQRGWTPEGVPSPVRLAWLGLA